MEINLNDFKGGVYGSLFVHYPELKKYKQNKNEKNLRKFAKKIGFLYTNEDDFLKTTYLISYTLYTYFQTLYINYFFSASEIEDITLVDINVKNYEKITLFDYIYNKLN